MKLSNENEHTRKQIYNNRFQELLIQKPVIVWQKKRKNEFNYVPVSNEHKRDEKHI